MTGSAYIDLAISVVGIALLVFLARMIFPGGRANLTLELAKQRLQFDEPDFAPTNWVVDAGDGSALARNADGEVALVYVHGGDVATRRAPASTVQMSYADGILIIAKIDHTSRAASIRMGADEAPSWLNLSA